MKNLKRKKIICFDLDGVICITKDGDYNNSKPIRKNIKKINNLYKKFIITIFTARFMGRTRGNKKLAENLGKKFTLNQLKKWNVKYDNFYMGKPRYDYYVDDKSIFFKKDWVKNINSKLTL
jgi:capsule biosynthesis phosphatase